jgi:dihydroneopterin triphosphate diphosphatase
MAFKQPRSIQVVIFVRRASAIEYLLLKRIATHGGFWQSVTGSLEGDETHIQAAVREVFEETGIQTKPNRLIDLGITNTFEIAPQWRNRYAPGVIRNEEICFALEVSGAEEIRLDRLEHDEYLWASYDRAMELLYWESSKRALAATHSLLAQMSK